MAVNADGKKVAVIGSGLIGRSWSMLFAAGGYAVSVYDIQPSQLARAKTDIEEQLSYLSNTGRLRGTLSASEQLKLIDFTHDLKDCVEGAFYVQECVPEKEELKLKVHHTIDNYVSNETIVASSSTAILPSILSKNLKHRTRFIVNHPTNPPFYAPLVELVPAPWTDQDVVLRAKSLMEEIGQVPVVLKKEIDGFILNRIQYAILAESFRLIQDDVVSTEDLGKVMSVGLGRRYAFMGPLEVAYLNANDWYSYADRYAETIHRVLTAFGPPIKLEGEFLDRLQSEMDKRVPVDKVDERRRWRDQRLAALHQLFQKLDDEDNKF